MTKKDDHLVKIASVKLQQGGLKGAEVQYEKTLTRNSRQVVKTRKENNSFPVHAELMDLFGRLGEYLLDICAYTTNETERMILLQELEVTGVTYGLSGFVLSGKLRVLGSNSKKVVALNTPLVTESDAYGDYEAVTAIIEEIYEETAAYMSGRKVISNDQLIMKFNANDDEFKAAFENLDEDAKQKMAMEILDKLQDKGKAISKKKVEDNGATIIEHDDIEMVEEETVGGTVIEMKEKSVSNELEMELDEPNFGGDEEDDLSFNLPVLEEKKVSTAKKIKQA